MAHSVVLVGCGNMGFAMLAGWLTSEPMLEAHVVEPAEPLRQRAESAGARVVADVADLPDNLAPELVILAVKPQMVAPVLGKCGALAETGTTFVSVAAGITIAAMAVALPAGTSIIRCMPNTPASIGEGMMALCAGPGVAEGARNLVTALFSSSGSVAWIEDEALMDAVTAISGSGPAYVFHFVEALTQAGEALGLPSGTAALLARQTVAGAGRMALISDTAPGILREQVTSPGGTTAAALEVLMTDGRLAKLVAEATEAARDRSIELGRPE
jgi:pyrroline-5-carboxylate reductase